MPRAVKTTVSLFAIVALLAAGSVPANHLAPQLDPIVDRSCDNHTCTQIRLDDENDPGNRLDTAPQAGPAKALLYWGDDKVLSGTCSLGSAARGMSIVNGESTLACEADDDSLAALTCTVAKVVKRSGGTWACGDDADSLAALSCANGEVVKRGGGSWGCGTDADSLAGLSCTDGKVVKRASGAWGCGDDADSLNGLTCTEGQITKWLGTSWACGTDDTLSDLSCVNGQVPKWSVASSAFVCGADNDSGGDITGVTVGDGLDGGADSGSAAVNLRLNGAGGLTKTLGAGSNELGLQACADAKILKRVAGAWACADDVDTDTNSGGDITAVTVGNGLVGGATSGDASVDLRLAAAGGLSRTLGAGNELGIASDSVLTGMIKDAEIVDADISASAGIAWSKISKTGSSIADLSTRSASDLSSGTLDVARMPTGGNWALTGSVGLTGANVGVGTLAPSSLFHVAKAVAGNTVAGIHNQGTGPTDQGLVVRSDGGRILELQRAGAASALVVEQNGNVGIGNDNPTRRLDVNGQGVIGNINLEDAAGYSVVGQLGQTTHMRFEDDGDVSVYSSSTPHLTVSSVGNVGIGATSPGQKLSVAGTVESTSGGFKFPDGSVQSTASVPKGMFVGTFDQSGASSVDQFVTVSGFHSAGIGTSNYKTPVPDLTLNTARVRWAGSTPPCAITWTVQKNNADTGMSVSFSTSDGEGTIKTSSTSVSFAAGDLVNVKASSACSMGRMFSWTIEYS